MLIFLIQVSIAFDLDCNPNACNPFTIGNDICSPSCMLEPCNFDSSENRFLDKITIMKASDCFESCTSLSSGCTLELLENDRCDESKNYAECNIKECAWDLGHCGYCAKNCSKNMLANGVCNEECDNAECQYDLKDCGRCNKNCKLELINNEICNSECYDSECDYDGKDCECAPNCKFEDYGKCKPACMVPDCNYDSIDTKCQDDDLRNFYRYFQLLNQNFTISQNIDFLNCASNSYENDSEYSLYCPIYESYKSGSLISENYCPINCLKCSGISNCVQCDEFLNFFTQCVSSCPAGYSSHPLISSICYKNQDLYSYINPKKIYVDYNTTSINQIGTQENPYNTLYDALIFIDSLYIEILLSPGIHEINDEIVINQDIISMTIRSNCNDCIEYAFLSIRNANFTFSTYSVSNITFLNLVIDREMINFANNVYSFKGYDDCPETNFINLIELSFFARFYSINVTFSNIYYNVASVIKAYEGAIKLSNTNFININTFNCPGAFSVINMHCGNFDECDFVYDSGIVLLNNGYFSSFIDFASSFLLLEYSNNIIISNVEFSNITVLEVWGTSRNRYSECNSLFCIKGYKQASFVNNTFKKIYSQNSIIEFDWYRNEQMRFITIFNNEVDYVWSSFFLDLTERSRNSRLNVTNLYISTSRFTRVIISMGGSDNDEKNALSGNIENIWIRNSTFAYIVYSNSMSFLNISSIYTKYLKYEMGDYFFNGIINDWDKIYGLGLNDLATSINGFLWARDGRIFISNIIIDNESYIDDGYSWSLFHFILLSSFDYISLENIELNSSIERAHSDIWMQNSQKISLRNIYVRESSTETITFQNLDSVLLYNVTTGIKDCQLNFGNCWDIFINSSFLDTSSILINSYGSEYDNIFKIVDTIFISSSLNFDNKGDYQIVNCSFFKDSRIVNSAFNGRGSWVSTYHCYFNLNTQYLIKIWDGNYQDFNSTFEGNNLIIRSSEYDASALVNISFEGTKFNNNQLNDSAFDLNDAAVTFVNCRFENSGVLSIASPLFISSSYFSNWNEDGKASLKMFGSKSYIINSRFLNINIISSSLKFEIYDSSFSCDEVNESFDSFIEIGENTINSIVNSSFLSNRPQIGIHSFGNNVVSIYDSFFKMMQPSEGGILNFNLGQLKISNIMMIGIQNDIKLHSEESAFIYFTNGIILDIKDSIFEGSINNAVYLFNTQSINIERSSFTNGVQSRALSIGSYVDCYLSDLQILNNTGNEIGSSIYFNNMLGISNATVNNCNFENNSAKLGGTVLDGCNITIKNSNFVNNTSDIGGAIASLCAIENENNYLTNNTFFNNNATIGGAIYWENNYMNLSSNSFDDSLAKYGSLISSKPTKLEIIKESYRLLEEIDNFTCDLGHNWPFQVGLVDINGEIVSFGYDNSPVILSCKSGCLHNFGDITQYPYNGVFDFKSISLMCAPGWNIYLTLKYDGKIFNFYRDKSYDISDIEITIKTKNCQKGEYNSLNGCEACREGRFSLDPSEDCKECPLHAYCPGGYKIVPLKGYWHGNNESSIIYACPNYNACKGGKKKDEIGYISLVGECAEGYRGNLCQPCDYNYSASGRNKCEKCPSSPETNASELVAIFIISIISLASIIYFSLKTAYEPKSSISIYFRILINYLQMIMFVARLNVNWPWYTDLWISSQGYPGEVPTHIMSIDCYLMDENDENSYKTIYFKKVIMIVILPAALGAAAAIFWLLIAIIKRKWDIIKNELIATLCIILFLILPSITDYMFSIFSCTYIYGNLYLISNMDIMCWKNDHLYYALAVALPGIIVWTIGFPACVFLYLYKRKYKLHSLDTKLRLGFLYIGYGESTYYWEFIIMIRKLMIICLTVFLTTETVETQVASCFSIFAIFYYIQYKYYPFDDEHVNKTELGSNFVILVTTWCGLFYINNNFTEIVNIMFLVFILLSNAYFVSKWAQAIMIELKQIIIDFFPSLKNDFDTRNNKKRIKLKPIFSLAKDTKSSLDSKNKIANSVDLSVIIMEENIREKEEQESQESFTSSGELNAFGPFSSSEIENVED